MEYAGETWVKRLRAGQFPGVRGVLIAVVLLVVGGAVLTIAEWTHPGWLARAVEGRRGFTYIIGPPALAIGGIVLGVGTRIQQRADRALIARIRRSTSPVLFVPVLPKGPFTSEDLPSPRPSIWTVDETGLQGWAPSREKPVLIVPWADIEAFELATNDREPVSGQRMDYGVRILGTRPHLVLVPRADLGRATGASAYRIDVLQSLLRSFQRQLDSEPRGRSRP